MRTIKLKILFFLPGVFEKYHQVLRESYAQILKNVVALILNVNKERNLWMNINPNNNKLPFVAKVVGNLKISI